jgi:uncharacterized protein (DUF58 family)
VLTPDGRVVAVAALVATLAGVVLDYRELVVLGLGLGFTLVCGALLLRTRSPLRVRREIRPVRVEEGDPALATVTVINDGRRRTPPLVAHERFSAGDIAIDLPALRPGAANSTSYLLPTERRGRYLVGPLTLSSSDPFRLLSAIRARGGQSTLIVHPRLYRATPLPTGRIREIDDAPSARTQRGGVAFHSLREYVWGDHPRDIHWRSSAKVGTLLVRHNVVSTQPSLLVVLDTCSTSYGGDNHFDDAVRVAASLVVAGIDASYPTEFATTAGVTVPPGPPDQQRTAVLDLLSGVETTDDDPGFATLIRLANQQRGVSLGVVTGHPDAGHLRALTLARSRFEATTLVQLRSGPSQSLLSVPGARVVACTDPADFERVWNWSVQ